MELFKILGTIAIDNEGANDALDDTVGKAEGAHSKISSAFSKIGKTAAKVGKVTAIGLSAVGSGIIALGTYATKAGSDFEAQMSKVAAISGATGSEVEALTAKAKQLGIDTKFSATEAGQAFEYMAMAGWSAEQMLDGVSGIMDLAAASGEDLALTSDIVTDALTAFGLKAEDSTRFADVLAQASSNANTNVALMGETFKYVAPVAGALGFSVEDTATAIGLMANAGIKGSQAGTALRALLSRLASPTKESGTAMEMLGLNITNADGTMREFNEILLDLRESFSGLSEAEQAQYAADLAGQEAMSGLLAIVNTSEEEFNKLTKAVNNSEGAAKRMADTMINNLSGKVTLLKSSLEGFGLALYENLQDPLMEAASWGIDAVNELTATMNEDGVEGVVKAVGNIFAKAVTEIANRLPKFVELAVSVVSNFVSGIQNNGEQIVTAAVNMCNTLILAITELLPQLIQLGWDLVVSFITGIAKNISGIVDSAKNMISKIVETLTNSETLKQLLDSALVIVSAIAEGIVEVLPELFEAAVEILVKLAEYLTDPENLLKIVETGIKLVGAIAKGLLDCVGTLAEGAGELVSTIVDTIFETDWLQVGKDIVTAIAEGFLDGLENLVGFFKEHDGLTSAMFDFGSSMSGTKPSLPTTNSGSSWTDIYNLPSHAEGLDYVPYDGYVAELHKGEMVVPAAESEFLRSGSTGAAIVEILQLQLDLLSSYFPQLIENAGHDIVTNDGAILARYAPLMNAELGRISNRKDRGR